MSQGVGAQGVREKVGRMVVAALALLTSFALWTASAYAAAPQVTEVRAAQVTTSSARLEALINPGGSPTEYHFEYGLTDCSKSACTKVPSADEAIGNGSSPVPVHQTLEGLQAGTVYHFRVVAKNPLTVKTPDQIFATYSPPLVGLPNNRAYEQASPVDKDGGDIVGKAAVVKAAEQGGGITFGSTFGIPGGKGAQSLPLYLAQREAGEGGWSTEGLLPPPSAGERARTLGWLPDLSEVFSRAIRLGAPRQEGLVVQSTKGGDPVTVGPYLNDAEYAYAGATEDGSKVLFESHAALPPKEGGAPIAEAQQGSSNVYAWDAVAKEVHLASVMNTPAETDTALPKGAFAGPYDWGFGINGATLNRGGAAREYYLQDTRAITSTGDVYFTAATTGQLYLRLNPTMPQSPLNGEGKCADEALACTIHVSASEKTDGDSLTGEDPAGPQPAAFQAASENGQITYFTSPEKLTNDSNTGPEQPQAAIARDTINGNPANIKGQFILRHAVGVAVRGSHVYWADPTTGTIGRATINPVTEEAEDINGAYIVPGETEYETHPSTEPGVLHSAPSAPRYVAVDAEHVYWTNTGPLGENTFSASDEEPVNGAGTIGRATINSSTEEAEDIRPEFITGAFNPQGIAVNASHIYWANAATKVEPDYSIGWAPIGGSPVDQNFVPSSGVSPYGLALDGSHLYFSTNEEDNDNGYVERVPLAGGAKEVVGLGKAGLRGLAIEGPDLYWASQGEGAIGRMPIAEFQSGVGGCGGIAGCEKQFLPIEGTPLGLAADAAHLYWSVNGEAPLNPGNDLYRFDAGAPAGSRLTDLTVTADPNGAEAQGVLAVSEDGSYVYFVANGALTGGAQSGNCETSGAHGRIASLSGHCGLYLWHEGQLTYIAQLNAGGGEHRADALDWVPSPLELFATRSYAPKRAFLSAGGKTLLFSSQAKLSAYDNEGTPELYRYRADQDSIDCVSCRPSGEEAGEGPSVGSINFPVLRPGASVPVLSHILSADGERVFFETAEALSPEDTNGSVECPGSGTASQAFPACMDVYEWEAPDTGSCKVGGDAYSPLNTGCVYLISTGKSPYPSLFADASSEGEDVFFFTRQSLVGQDQDELQDVYDARKEGGLASQNLKPSEPCESAEACRNEGQPPLEEVTPATQAFHGPPDPKPKHAKKAKKHHKRHHKKGGKKHKQAKGKSKAKGRAGR